MNNLKKKKKGFTLVELMAVIAIIAILAAVLVPTVNGYINRSKKVAVITQIRTAISAVDAYNATGGTAIPEGSAISTLAASGGTLATAELLVAKDVNKLGATLTVQDAREINANPNAINSIVLADGVYASGGK